MMTESTNNQGNTASGPEPAPTDDSGSGKALIIGIVLVALLMSGYAWWHQKQKGRRTLEFWGSRIALRLRYGKEIELLQLTSPETSDESASGDTLGIDGQSWGIAQSKMISKAKGLVHARQALVFDPSYEWTAAPHKPPVWQYALRFTDEVAGESDLEATTSEQSNGVVLLFDLEHSVAGTADGSRTVQITIADGLKKFFEENLQ